MTATKHGSTFAAAFGGACPPPSGAHLVAEWGDREGVQHRRCRCGAEGSGTAGEAEAAVAGCRAARAAQVAS